MTNPWIYIYLSFTIKHKFSIENLVFVLIFDVSNAISPTEKQQKCIGFSRKNHLSMYGSGDVSSLKKTLSICAIFLFLKIITNAWFSMKN